MPIKRTAILALGLLLVGAVVYGFVQAALNYDCYPVGPSTTTCGPERQDKEVALTIEQAIEKGFPIYMPSNQTIESLDLSFPPTITMKIYDSTCSYLEILFKRGEDSSLFARMLLSNGCAYPVSASMYSQEIEWAKDQIAFLVEVDNGMFIVVQESESSFQYLIFPEASVTTTLELLKSMSYIGVDHMSLCDAAICTTEMVQ